MRVLKRGIDLVLALAILAAILPLLAAIAVAIWVETGAPVLYRCQRHGRDGRPFTMYKFRTMAPGSDRELESLRARNLAQGMVKIPDDPRVTPLGRLLRRFSLDELPQLWNVIRGQMSLVGPRPHELWEISLADQVHRQRLEMRPGITGLWQIRARTNPSLAVRVHHDLEYIANWSLLSDFAILVKTIPVLLQGRGGAPRVHGHDLVPEVAGGDRARLKAVGVERLEHGAPLSVGRQHD
jgi:lipopolysaccharide/colanic/teichoic acid biosynthesis glycosyltransferase